MVDQSLSKALAFREHSFTAYATEKSAAGNPTARARTVGFRSGHGTAGRHDRWPESPSNEHDAGVLRDRERNTEVVVHVL